MANAKAAAQQEESTAVKVIKALAAIIGAFAEANTEIRTAQIQQEADRRIESVERELDKNRIKTRVVKYASKRVVNFYKCEEMIASVEQSVTNGFWTTMYGAKKVIYLKKGVSKDMIMAKMAEA